MSSPSPFLEMRGIDKRFGSQHVLRGVDLSVYKGESLVIIGGSGTGKSLLLKMAMGLIPVTEGSISLDGSEITHLTERQLGPHRRKLGMLFQDGALFDSFSVADNVAFPLREAGLKDPAQIQAAVADTLAAVGLTGHGHKYPSALSGGMRKRAALARAVIHRPSAIFFDEPTAGLDPIVSDSIDLLIRSIQKRYGCTCVTVTHDMKSVRTVADRVVYLKDGRIFFTGPPEALFTSTDPKIIQFIEGRSSAEDPLE